VCCAPRRNEQAGKALASKLSQKYLSFWVKFGSWALRFICRWPMATVAVILSASFSTFFNFASALCTGDHLICPWAVAASAAPN